MTAQEWKPIETCPRDGSQFLANAPDLECGVSIMFFERGRIRSAFNGMPLAPHITQPTKWMPLPPPPES